MNSWNTPPSQADDFQALLDRTRNRINRENRFMQFPAISMPSAGTIGKYGAMAGLIGLGGYGAYKAAGDIGNGINQLFNPNQKRLPDPQYGTSTAIDAFGNKESVYLPNSNFNTDWQRVGQEYLSEEEKRIRGAMDYTVRQQMNMENFRNQYRASEAMLNRYLDLSKMSMESMQGAYSQRF